MKSANFLSLLLLVVAISLGATGCKKNVKSPTPIPGRTGQNAPADRTPSDLMDRGNPVREGDGTQVRPLAGPGENVPMTSRPNLGDYNQDPEMFKQQTVYFDFDKYNIKPGELSKVQTVASYLKGQANEAILIEGHCDERGTPEYNRALGDRRALSVRESLINLGISGDRVFTVSYGEDRPADPGHNEAAWAKNRRGVFVLLKPKSGGPGSELR